MTAFTDPGAGRANCQTFTGLMETLMIRTSDNPADKDAGFSIGSAYFDNIYLRMDATTFTQASTNGGGVVNCQYTAKDWEKFKFYPQPDGTKAIGSVSFPGMFLRMDGSMQAKPEGYGSVNCQTSVGPWEKFIVSELNDGLNRAELEEAIAKYGPILKLHKDEIYENCSVEWFLERTRLVDSKSGTFTIHPTADDLPQGEFEANRFWFEPDAGAKSGDMSTAIAYVRARWTQGMTYTDLQFWFFSAYNGPGTAKVNGLFWETIIHGGDATLAPLGEHVGDWECCTIRVDNKGKHVLKIILSQHGDAVSFEGNDISRAFQWADSTHPVVYSSRNGHALYATVDANLSKRYKYSSYISAGIEAWLRNDTSDGGKSLDCSKQYQVISADFLEKEEAYEQPGWVNYRYRWGPEGTAKLSAKAITEIMHAALGWLAATVPGALVELLALAIAPPIAEKDLNGPQAPMSQPGWNGQD
jgi:hypothetical protein